MQLETIDIVLFVAYVIGLIALALWVSREKPGHNTNTSDYFLAGNSLPWWAIASYEWMAAITLIIVGKHFLPVFLKRGIYTMPQFLEQRYDHRVRTILAVFWLGVYIFVNLTAVLWLGALAINTITVGDYLYSRQLDTTAEVVAWGDQEVTLQAGLMRVTVPVSDLQKPATKPDKQKQRSFQKTRKTSAVTAAKEAAPVQRECDVRGQRVDEALTGVEKFIDDALLANVEVVAVIHGHGTGALKLAIREALKQNPAVQKFYPSELDQGGDGRTVIEL